MAHDQESIVENTMKELAEDFHPVREMQDHYHCRIIDAAVFNGKFTSDRRALGKFMGFDAIRNIDSTIKNLEKGFTSPRRKDWADLFIIYMIDEKPEQIDEALQLLQENPVDHPRILVALPKEPSRIGVLLLLYKTMKTLHEKEEDYELRMGWLEKLKDIQAQLKAIISWENWNWFYRGGIVEKEENVPETGVISILMEKLFSESFDPGLKALGRLHRPGKSARKSVRAAVEKILNVYSPIIITREKRDPASPALQKVAQWGMLTRISEPGWEEIWRSRDKISEDSPVHFLWEDLENNVLQPIREGKNVSFKSILDSFIKPPRGLTNAMFKLIFSLFWRCYNDHIMLQNHRGRKIEKNALTFQRLTDMVKYPEKWELVPHKLSQGEKKLFLKLLGLFSPEMAPEESPEALIEEVKHSLYDWYDGLPRITLHQNYENQAVREFLRVIKKQRKADSRELFSIYIPQALGLNLMAAAEPGKAIEDLIGSLDEVIDTINKDRDKLPEILWEEVSSLLELPGEDGEARKKLNLWLDEISAPRYSKLYRGDTRAIYEMISGQGEKPLKEIVIEDLPEKMGMPPMEEWLRNRVPELVSRLKKAIYQMSVMNYLEIKNTRDSRRKMELINQWFLKLFKQLEFPPEELEQFLEEYLEEVVEGKSDEEPPESEHSEEKEKQPVA